MEWVTVLGWFGSCNLMCYTKFTILSKLRKSNTYSKSCELLSFISSSKKTEMFLNLRRFKVIHSNNVGKFKLICEKVIAKRTK